MNSIEQTQQVINNFEVDLATQKDKKQELVIIVIKVMNATIILVMTTRTIRAKHPAQSLQENE